MMYEDTLEKPKNPLRRAMRRRGQKQVTFSEPTYRDAPQYDYSSEEEEDGENGESVNGVHEDTASQNGVDRAQDEEDITTAAVNARGTAAAQSHSQQDSIDDTENEATGRTSDEYVERSKFLVFIMEFTNLYNSQLGLGSQEMELFETQIRSLRMTLLKLERLRSLQTYYVMITHPHYELSTVLKRDPQAALIWTKMRDSKKTRRKRRRVFLESLNEERIRKTNSWRTSLSPQRHQQNY